MWAPDSSVINMDLNFPQLPPCLDPGKVGRGRAQGRLGWTGQAWGRWTWGLLESGVGGWPSVQGDIPPPIHSPPNSWGIRKVPFSSLGASFPWADPTPLIPGTGTLVQWFLQQKPWPRAPTFPGDVGVQPQRMYIQVSRVSAKAWKPEEAPP